MGKFISITRKFILIFLVFSYHFTCFGQVPVIDGAKDSYWEAIQAHEIKSDLSSNENLTHEDLNGIFKASWVDSALFIYIEVTDDSLFVQDTLSDGTLLNHFEKDNLEIFIDLTNSKTEFFTSDHVMWRTLPGLSDSISEWQGDTNISEPRVLYGSKRTSKGYISEFSIHKDIFPGTKNLQQGQVIGFDIKITDNDGIVGEMPALVSFNSNKKNMLPYLFGTLRLKEHGEVEVLDSLVVDAIIEGAWRDAPVFNITIPVDYYKTGEDFTVDDEDDFSAYFRVRWDTSYIYLLGVVKDEDYSTFMESIHNRDNFGVYMDIANAKGFEYDENIRTWKCGYDGNNGSRWLENNNYYKNLLEAYYVNAGKGYIYECAIPADMANKDKFKPGDVFGWDVKVNDVDYSNEVYTRDQLGWEDEYDLIWRYPYRFGAIELLEGGLVKGYNLAPDIPEINGSIDSNAVTLYWTTDTIASDILVFKDGFVIDTVSSIISKVVYKDLDFGFHSFSLVARGPGNLWSEFSYPYDNEIFSWTGYPVNEITVPGSIKLFPQPTCDHLNINAGFEIYRIEIYSITGIKVHSSEFNYLKQVTIPVSHLQEGMYLMRLYRKNGMAVNKAFIKANY